MTKLAASLDKDVHVVAFGEPLRALDYVRRHIPDLMIIDFEMQPIGGDEFIVRFRSLPACANVPTIALTTHQDEEFRLRALASGVTDFLVAPLDNQDFRVRARSLLVRSSSRRATEGRSEANSAAMAVTEMLNDMLLTVNAQLSTTLTALEFASRDLNGLIEATQAAAIFVDGATLVRKFTPAAASLFKIKSLEVGRPLTQFSSDFDLSDFAADFDRACLTDATVKKYVHMRNGRTHYLMTIYPHRDANRANNGAVITFTRPGISYSGHSQSTVSQPACS